MRVAAETSQARPVETEVHRSVGFESVLAGVIQHLEHEGSNGLWIEHMRIDGDQPPVDSGGWGDTGDQKQVGSGRLVDPQQQSIQEEPASFVALDGRERGAAAQRVQLLHQAGQFLVERGHGENLPRYGTPWQSKVVE